MTPDLAALTAEPWRHFAAAGEDEEDALATLRARLGPTYADDDAYPDAELTAALGRAVVLLERVTGRVFTARAGTISVDGTGENILWLPLPVVSSSQLEGAGVTEIVLFDDTDPVDPTSYVVNDGIGPAGADPRERPVIELVSTMGAGDTFVSRSPEWAGRSAWPIGRRNVHITGTFGYVDEIGETPELARQALCHLLIRALVTPDDQDGRDDLRGGALLSESVQGRSWTLAAQAAGTGITTDREVDQLLMMLRAPPRPKMTPRPRKRPMGRRSYFV